MTSYGHRVVVARLLVALTLIATCAAVADAELMIVGNDQKVVFDAEGNRQFVAPGKDTIAVVDITDREAPKIVAMGLVDRLPVDRQVGASRARRSAQSDPGFH